MKKRIDLANYWPTFRPSTIEIPTEGGSVTQGGTMVHLKGVGDVLFIHKSLIEGDNTYVIAHSCGLTIGLPTAENFRQAKLFARILLGSKPFCEHIKPTKEEMIQAWPGSEGSNEVYTFNRLVSRERSRIEAEEREAAWAAEKPTLEQFLEDIAEKTEEMELWLHDEFEDEVIEWVEEMSAEDKEKVLSAVVEACSDYRGRDLTYISDRSNGQLGDPDKDMVLGDWWLRPEGKLQMSKFCKLIEACGADYSFNDSHALCTSCLKAVETSPTHYGWQRQYHVDEDGVLCSDCIEEDPSSYLEHVRSNPEACVTSGMLDPEDHGYTKVWGQFENGLYGGQMDTPQAIAEAFEERGWTDFIFVLDSVGQFDMKFSVFVKTHEDSGEVDEDGDIVWEPSEDFEYQFIVEDRYPRSSWRTYPKENLDGSVMTFSTHEEAEGNKGAVYVWPNFKPGETKADIDPADAMKAGLQAAAKQQADLPAESKASGVVYSQIHGDGTASTRVVSPEDFVAGNL